MDSGERSGKNILLVLLDWEKAFDKVTRQAISHSLKRLNVPPKMHNVVMPLYQKPKFKVQIDGSESQMYEQETGIRQGCPLSPYLFLLIMTTMFHDIHSRHALQCSLIKNKIQGACFDEVLYADDTICISEDTRTMNKLLAAIEEERQKYGLKLNKSKCEALITGNDTADIQFANGEKLKKGTEQST